MYGRLIFNQDTHRDPGRRFFILADFPCLFTDDDGVTDLLVPLAPTWRNIVRQL